MDAPLHGRKALVTGGGRNIGRAIALALARQGADVAVLGRSDLAAVGAVADEIRALGRNGAAVIGDVADPDSGPAAVRSAIDALGGLDVLVNNAAVRRHAPFEDIDYAEWRAIVGVILDGAYLCAQAAAPALTASGQGAIVNLGGVSAHKGAPERTHVIAAKMGLIGLTRGLAHDLAPSVTVNCVAPGLIDTTRRADQPLPSFEPGAGPLVGRKGGADDVAGMVVFLAGPGGRYVTGQTIHVNGGLFLG